MPAPSRSSVVLIASVCLALMSCSGKNGLGQEGCSGSCTTAADFLSAADVERVIAQGAFEAQARGARATIAVTDRVGNVLGVFRMAAADPEFAISSEKGVRGGLEGARLPDTLAAIAKAITGAYLSSEGNAFSTRTASQIIQENFYPKELSLPSGPLYGVQFSQLPCSDVMNGEGTLGPKPSPLGLSADPGGLPLYKDGRLVGGVGVISDSLYSLDADITDIDSDQDELIAVGAAASYMSPPDRRADRITADGRTFRFTDSEVLLSNPLSAPPLSAIPGTLVAVSGFFDGKVRRGVAFKTAESGYRADTEALADIGGHILVNAQNQNRFPPRSGKDLTAAEVASIVRNGILVAKRTRAQIRRPQGANAEATMVVVDTNGDILGLARTADGPIFGTDIAVQKARTAAFFSSPNAAAELERIPSTQYAGSLDFSRPASYVERARVFLKDPSAFSNGIAYSARSIGNLHRPYFPDGLEGSAPGPFSTPHSNWSPFHVGLQLDIVNTAIVNALLGKANNGCVGLPQLRGGMQIFPGGVPVYRGSQLVGGVGVSGDGVDQDDMIAFLGLAYAGREMNTGIGNAPRAMRSDTIEPQGRGTRLKYVQCPQAPFIDSTEQNVCAAF
ncbi:MAG: heme-binding protein [Vicinamibacteria bacterium]|nr:heme-binding protein [Vicinamibacteria bacterium]